MSDQQIPCQSDGSSRKSRASTFTIVLATIGGLALSSFILFLLFSLLIVRGSISKVSDLGGPSIGVVPVADVITDASDTLKAMRDFAKDDDVKAIILRIDSPGGAVGASQEIYAEARRIDKIKPVVASLGNVAASGGFYAACGSRYIVANPGSITGSIGVIMTIPNLSELMQKIGIRTTVLKSGRLKDLASMTRELTPEERAVLQGVMDDLHAQFMEDVASARKMDLSVIRPIADGRIFSGRQAFELGLIDETGNFYQAVKKAAEFAGLEGEPRLCYPEQDKLDEILNILEGSGARMLFRLSELLSYSRSSAAPN